jgi:hypothetical protein
MSHFDLNTLIAAIPPADESGSLISGRDGGDQCVQIEVAHGVPYTLVSCF